MKLTLKKNYGNYNIKLTQNLNEKFDFGHYNWVIEDTEGNIELAGYSIGSPPNRVTEKKLDEIFNRWRGTDDRWRHP